MALDVVALALLAAILWGASHPVSKLGLENGGSPIQVALTVVTVSVVVYTGALLIRGEQFLGHAPEVLAIFIAAGLAGTALGRFFIYMGINRVGASVNSAGVNTRPVFATVGAVVFLDEVLTFQTGVGILIVVVGLITVAISKGGNISGWKPTDMIFPLGAAMLFATGNVLRRFGLTVSDVTSLEGVAINELAGLVGLIAYVLVSGNHRVGEFAEIPRVAYGYAVGCGLLSAGALFSLFEALNRGQVVIVDPISSPTSLFSLLFTALLLRDFERITGRLIVGVVLVILGVLLITAPQLGIT